MLISPPFLPPRGNQSEEQWLQTAMQGGTPGTGAYPVSAQLDWHGGIHLTAPMNGTTAEPVRAIADGTVIFVRETTRTDDPKHPLCYGGGYTSDGVVVIRHDTEIGVDARDQPVAVRFYSIYHHLFSIRPTVMRNRPIWRKDAIGQAGHIYGVPNQIHFEIRCDEENLRKLIGRTSGDVPLDRDGRMDVLYGEMYFLLPIGAPIYGERPLSNSPVARVAGRNGSPTAIQALQPVAQTAEALVVGVRYAGGQGDAGHRGDAFVTTYRLDGSTLGPPRGESEAEYKLYEDCMAISKSYPANAQPAPSAVLELLRFGRVIGPDALTPADVPHWRQITHAGGTGWVNLNAANVRKYSDADFPQWKGWRLISDDVNNDARCDSPTLKSWLDADGDKNVDPIEGVAALIQNHIQNRMRKTVCKIPSEWNTSTLDSRWNWLTSRNNEGSTTLSAEEYTQFKQHAQALCIDSPELFTANWTFNPAQFTMYFRACGWLSTKEAIQSIPLTVRKLHNSSFREENIGANTIIGQRIQRWLPHLNKALRKYGLNSAQRKIHAFANVWEETGYLRLMEEGNGSARPYAPWWGRGLIQLTHLNNYKWFGDYRKFPKTISTGQYSSLGWSPDLLISSNDFNCIDTIVYWINPKAVATGHNALIDADTGLEVDHFTNTAKSTNGNVSIENINGLDGRLQVATYLKFIFTDEIQQTNSRTLTFSWRSATTQTGVRLLPNGTQKRIFEPTQHTIEVNTTPRRPLQ